MSKIDVHLVVGKFTKKGFERGFLLNQDILGDRYKEFFYRYKLNDNKHANAIFFRDKDDEGYSYLTPAMVKGDHIAMGGCNSNDDIKDDFKLDSRFYQMLSEEWITALTGHKVESVTITTTPEIADILQWFFKQDDFKKVISDVTVHVGNF